MFSENDIAAIVNTRFGIHAVATPLTGEYEHNFLLTDASGVRHILKIAGEEHPGSFFEAQIAMTRHLEAGGMGERFPRYLPNRGGELITHLHWAGRNWYMRLLTFLEGTFWMDTADRPDSLYADLGRFLGRMDHLLGDFAHPAMHRRYLWDISNAAEAEQKISCIADPERRRMVASFLLRFQTEALPAIPALRHAYVHHDANDTNILVQEGTVTGLIDFSDMVYTALINNLAVACTYAMMNHEDPIRVAAFVVSGYHKEYPLELREADLLFFLIGARLCISVTQSAYNATLDTANEHHFVSESSAWDLLYRLIRINPLLAQDQFRKACGFPGCIGEANDHSHLLRERANHLGRNLSLSYAEPLKIIRGTLQYLYDDRGRCFVDCVNNPAHVGHCHPGVVKRIQEQVARLNTNTRYLHDNIVAYAKRLTDLLPPALRVCYFTNSGSEANDLALRIARHYTGQDDIIVLDHAYHGTSTLTMDISPYKFEGKGGFPKRPWVHKAESPDRYRGSFGYDDPDAGVHYAAGVAQIIEDMKNAGREPAAFICETLLGVGGQVPLPPGYLEAVYSYVRGAGGLCIADEVQVGFGRVGACFWGFELQQVVPDIVVMGKPIGNGHPLGAVVVTEAVAERFHNGMEYFNTFGGNPVSMAAGLTVLDVMEEEGLQQHALETGNYLMQGLRSLAAKHDWIGDVRGHGLFIGAELVRDQRTKEPAVPEIDHVIEYIKEKGYLLSTDGPLHNVLKIKPPLPFNRQNAEELLQYLDEALKELGTA